MIQKPTPQLNVFSISLSLIFFTFNPFKNFFYFNFEKRSIFIDKFLGIDLNKVANQYTSNMRSNIY